MKVTKFDSLTVSQVRNAINDALKIVGHDLGLELHLGNIKFSEGDFTGKFEAKIPGAQTFKEKTSESMIGMVIRTNSLKTIGVHPRDGEYELVGFNSRKSKNKFTVKKASDGKTYICNEQFVRSVFGTPETPKFMFF